MGNRGKRGVSQSYYSNFPYGTTFTGTLTGSNTGYSNSGGVVTVNWAGTAGPAAALQINMQTTIDTQGSAIVFTVHLINTTATTLTGVYYLRTADPDNTESWSPLSTPASTWTGEFETYNTVIHQNEDATHRVMVTAIGEIDAPTAGIEMLPTAYFALGTRDCRAKAFVYTSWPLASTYDLSTVWGETFGTPGVSEDFTIGSTALDGDHGFGLVYNLGNIAGFDSAVISYAYIFNGVGRFADSGLENPGVFPDPRLLVADSLMPTVPIPNRVYDTFDVCGHPGDDTVIVNILYSTTGNWTNSRWTWSPSTGLTSTTGTVDTILSSVLPPSITYTITGTDSSGPGTMLNCENRVFYLTILTCNSCVNNSPCAGDTLYLIRKGDSTDCTYLWSGPDGFTSTLQDPFIYPAIAANTGEYYVIRTLLGVRDTDSTNVVIHPLPIVTVTSNAPLCTGVTDTLHLSVTPYTAGETFSWTGPDAFTSALQFPVVDGFMPINAGIYKVVATTSFGCTDSGTVDAELVPPPPGPPITGITQYCYGATFVPFVAGGTDIMWYPRDTSTLGTATPPVVNTSVPGTYTYYATQQLGSCISPKDSITVQVFPRIVPAFTPIITHGCTSDQVTFYNNTANSTHYTWTWGDGSNVIDPTPALLSHTHTYPVRDTYAVTITGYNVVCSLDTTIVIDTRHSVYSIFTPIPDTFCVFDSPVFYNGSYAIVYPLIYTGAGPDSSLITNYLWNFGDGSPTLTTATRTNPGYEYVVQGAYNVILTVTDSISCQDTSRETVYSLQIHIRSVNDTTLCLSQPLPLYNTETLVPNINLSDYNYVWTQSSPNLDDTSVHVPYLTGFGDFVDTLTVTLPGILPDGCPARDTITVHSVLGAAVIHVTPNTTIPYGSSIDLNSDGQVYYWWLPNDGSLNNNNINNPVATPLITTTYTVFGLDSHGCLDSAYVTITVDSTSHEGIPGAFSPNGDGLNDVWHPVGLKYQKLVEYRIFNRWGQQVFYSNDINKGWDGTFNGVPQDIGVYYYVIIIANPGSEGGNIIYKGDLTLLR